MITNFYSLLMYDMLWMPLFVINLLLVSYIHINKKFSQFFLQLNFSNTRYSVTNVYNKFLKVYSKYYYFIFNLVELLLMVLLINLFTSYCYTQQIIYFVFQASTLTYSTSVVLLLAIFVSVVMIKLHYNSKFINFYEHFFTIMLLLLSTLYYLVVNNLLALIFILELQSILFIYLLSSNYNINTYFTDYLLNSKLKIYNLNSLWYFSSLIYQFWVSFFGSILLFYGVLLILKMNFLFDWAQFDLLNYFFFFYCFDLKGYYFSFLVLFIGFVLKLGLFPFFVWKPEIYKNLTLTTLFVYMFSYLFAFLLIFIFFFTTYFVVTINFWYYYIYLIVYVCLLILPFFVYSITEIRVFLAYISVIHIFLIFLGVFGLEDSSINISYFYFFSYMFFTLNFFIILFSLTTNSLWYLTDLQFYSSVPIVSTSLLVLFLNYAGLPPLFGFFTKISILFSFVVSKDYFLFIWILLINFFFIYFYLQNYRFLGFSLTTYDFYFNLINFKRLYIYKNYLLFFIFFSLNSVFFFSDLFIIFNPIF